MIKGDGRKPREKLNPRKKKKTKNNLCTIQYKYKYDTYTPRVNPPTNNTKYRS